MGCLVKLLFGVLIIAGIVVYIAIRSSSHEESATTPPSPQVNSVPSRAPAVPPKVDPTPTAEAAAQVLPSVSEATQSLDAAAGAALRRLKVTPAYRDASGIAEQAMTKLENMRRADVPAADRLSASSDYNKAAAVVRKMEAAALSSDPAVRSASEILRESKQRERLAAAEREGKRFAEARDSEERSRIQREKIENDPINVAIKEHRLIRGMTYNQAIQAVGLPYSITDGGYIRIATWQRGSGNFWSATFVGGEATIVDHTIF